MATRKPTTEAAVTWAQVARWRMSRQLLDSPLDPGAALGGAAGGPPGDPGGAGGGDGPLVAVARAVVGVHAQVAASAVAALDLRVAGGVSAAAVDAALHERRTLVKTWAARGTLHLLPAADLPVWVAAMSTRSRETTGSWLRYHGVTAEQMADLLAALPDVLAGEPLTREELAAALVAATGHADLAGPLTHGFGAVLKPAAFRGLLCFGPPRGRNVTFVAPRAWLGTRAAGPTAAGPTAAGPTAAGPTAAGPTAAGPAADVDAAIDALVLAHLGAYGPADHAEFARWFDLRPPLARRSFARLAAAGAIAYVDVAGSPGAVPRELVEPLAATTVDPDAPVVRLLPAFDPYVAGSTRQLAHLMPAERTAEVSRPQGWLSPTLVVDGRIAGVWARDGDALTVTPFAPLPAPVRRALAELAPDATLAG